MDVTYIKLNDTGVSYLYSYWERGRLDDLNQAVHFLNEALKHTPFDSPYLSTILNNLGASLDTRYKHRGRLEDLEQAITTLQKARQHTPADSPKLPNVLTNLGISLRARFEHKGQLEDLEQAIAVLQEAVQRIPADSSELPSYLSNLGNGLVTHYHYVGRVEDLEQAIAAFETAIQRTPPDSSELHHYLNNLGNALRSRYDYKGQLEDLERAVASLQEAVQQAPPSSPALPGSLSNLGISLHKRYKHTGQLEDLRRAIRTLRRAVKGTPPGSPELSNHLDNLGEVLLDFYNYSGRLEDLKRAIRAFQEAVKTTPPSSPDLPDFLSDLGGALQSLYNHNGVLEDLEQAIRIYQRAIQQTTLNSSKLPDRLNNLGRGLLAQYEHSRQLKDLEQATKTFQKAVKSTPPDSPQLPVYLNNLGTGYYECYRQSGRLEDLEQAIEAFETALQVNTQQVPLQQWAMAQKSLGNAYSNRLHGERAENIEQAIFHYQQALQVHTQQAFPENWARTHHNLAKVYSNHLHGERAENIEQAIFHCRQALQVCTQQAFPEWWAMTQNNLAVAYRDRLRGERAENIEQAIFHCRQALQVFTQQAFPEDWAIMQNTLAVAYRDRLRGERAENIEQAIFHCQQTLQVHTQQAFPEWWAMAQHNLATAYRERIRGERAKNLEQAIFHYQQALEVRTPLTFPHNCRDTAYMLGYLLYKEHRFSEARHALETAHQAVEALRGEVQRDVAKRSLAEENADLYARLVSCCLNAGDAAAAFEYVVTGKGRAFVDLLATARLDLSASSASDPALAEDLYKVRELRQQIDNLLAILTGESGSSHADSSPAFSSEISDRTSLSPEALHAQLSTLQAQEASHWEEMAYKYPALTATQKAPVLSVDHACTLAAELNATLVEYYRHAEGWCAFVVTPHTVHYVPLPLIDNNLLERLANWVRWIEHRIGRNPRSYSRLSQWYDALITPLEAYLLQEQSLILAPFGVLHVLPLAAARHPRNGHYLAEDYLLSFAPSLSVLRTLWEQAHRTGRGGEVVLHHLLNVAYAGTPDSDHYLPNVLPEAEAIARHFTQITPLYGEEATPDAVLAHCHNQDVVHFGCHGWFDTEQPEQSGLLLAGGWLTVRHIINELHLEQVRLATLGACLSGQAALLRGDEHIGLLQAMLTPGVQVVVASLWKVDDTATRALFEAFYAELVAGRSSASAMQEAAWHVRAQSGWRHPYYWAAFQVSGLAYVLQESKQVLLSPF